MIATLLFAVALAATPAPASAGPTPTPTPTVTPTPTPEARNPRFVVSLESWQGLGRERTALFDDGTLIHTITYRGIATSERRAVSHEEIEVVRRVCQEALAAGTRDVDDPGRSVLGDADGRRTRLEVADPKGGVRSFVYDDLQALPIAVGRARGAIEDLRARFAKEDPSERAWDTKALKAGSLLKKRADGIWYRIVHDDALDHDFELEELAQTGDEGSHKLRLFVYRGDLPRLFEDPAKAGPAPTPVPPARR